MKNRARILPMLLFALLFFPANLRAGDVQEAAPLLSPKPIFVPGMYETESRNSHFQDQPAKSRLCIASADYDAFRRETIEQYEKSPAFLKQCRLSEERSLPNGFAFAMKCKGNKIILTYQFSKDLVSGTQDNLIEQSPAASSKILTLMRRMGDCPGQPAPGKSL